MRIRIVDFSGAFVARAPGDAELLAQGGTPFEADDYRYDADVRIGDTCTTPMRVIDEAFRAALAQIGAHTVKEIESFD